MSNFHRRIIIAAIFFYSAVLLVTLKDYGINWDNPIHFLRGQAYLNLFLSGETTFQNPEKLSHYQHNSFSAEYFLENDSGHPPLNGILASLTNKIFFEKLGLMGEIESYHLFIVLCAIITFTVVIYFTYEQYGIGPSLISAIALGSYPLFFAESHFNIKDPPQAALFTLFIYAFWKSTQTFSWKWLLLAIISFVFGLSIKLNIIFAPLILAPFVLAKLFQQKKLPKMNSKYVWILLLSPIIIVTLYIALWPFLWSNPLTNFLKILQYYKDIGTTTSQPGYYLYGFNLYPIFWIIITTPPVVLVLSVFGILHAIRNIGSKNQTSTLLLLWLVIPIARVTIPGTSIYGGVRQIFEYIPPLAILSGLGALHLANILKFKKNFTYSLILASFIPHLLLMYKIHPNQNVYFNFLIGGLSGAKQQNIHNWGNSYGNAYKQTIDWINENAEPNAKVALIEGTGQNIPKFEFRKDIEFSNEYWSGIKREGEYLIELIKDSPINPYPYAWDYVNFYLKPVFEVKVDGVTIASVWKNDFTNTNPEFQLKEEIYDPNLTNVVKKNNSIFIYLNSIELLNKVSFEFNRNKDCNNPNGVISTSIDQTRWIQEKQTLAEGQIPGEGLSQNKKDEVIYYFANVRANVVKITANKDSVCMVDTAKKFEVSILK